MAKSFDGMIWGMEEGQSLADPSIAPLRYRRHKTGVFAEFRYKEPVSGKWRRVPLGRLSAPGYRDAEGVATVEPGAELLMNVRHKATGMQRKLVEGTDPRTETGPQGMPLARALDLYETGLEQRQLVNRQYIMARLRKEMLGSLGNVPLGTIERRQLAEVLKRIATKPAGKRYPKGRPGTAKYFRTEMSVFLEWAVNEGFVAANVLAGMRKPRETRAQRLERVETGRALADSEIPLLWQACEQEGKPFGPFVQLLLLTGQRRTETTRMRWSDVDLTAGEWRIPIEETKSGRAHRVPLSPLAVEVLKALCPRKGPPSGYVFKGRDGKPMTGWSKRMRRRTKKGEKGLAVTTAAAGMAPWTFHDLRRTMRTGLAALGIPDVIAEMALNHAVSDSLKAAYDRHDYYPERVEAALKWDGHVCGCLHQSLSAAE